MAENIEACNRKTEYSKLMAILNFKLPHSFKKFGVISALLVFAFLIAYKFMGADLPLVKDILRGVMLLFLLIACLSKDKFEDEYSNHLRYQSYIIAFVFSTMYAVLIPLIAVVIDLLITKVSGDGVPSFFEISSFEILFNIMALHLFFFEVLKKYGNAQ